jgi:hypothetical protein
VELSSGWRHWLCHLGGIVRVVFEFRTMVGAKCWNQDAEGYSIPNMGRMSRYFDARRTKRAAEVSMKYNNGSKCT